MVFQGRRHLCENGRWDVLGQTGAAVLRQTDDVRIGVSAPVLVRLGRTIRESSQPQGPSLLMTRGHSWTAEVEGRGPCGALG